MKSPKRNLDKHPEIKIDESLNLGLDADSSSNDLFEEHNTDNDQVSGNTNNTVTSPIDEK
ncbi:MAG: hypothetical protein V4687_01875 [Bacteroidota bacterium]